MGSSSESSPQLDCANEEDSIENEGEPSIFRDCLSFSRSKNLLCEKNFDVLSESRLSDLDTSSNSTRSFMTAFSAEYEHEPVEYSSSRPILS